MAWFGIGLGLAELLAPRAVADAAGLREHERLVQAAGLRAYPVMSQLRRPANGTTLQEPTSIDEIPA